MLRKALHYWKLWNFIFQVPDSSSNVASWINAELQLIRYRVMLRKALYYWKICNKTKDELLKECLQEVMVPEAEDQWFNDIKQIEEEIGISIAALTTTQVTSRIVDAAVQFVLDNKREHPSVICMPQPERWFVQQHHVTDLVHSKVLNMTRAGNLGLGNRMKNRNDKQYKLCPWCKHQGVDVREVLWERAKKIYCIKKAWLTKCRICKSKLLSLFYYKKNRKMGNEKWAQLG